MEQSLNYFGKNLQFLRKEKKLKQHQMFEHLGFSRTTWSNYEQCRTSPSLDGLIKISRFFGVKLDELIAEDMEEKHESRKYRRYGTNDSPPMVEESLEGLAYLRSRLEKLETAIDMMRHTREESSF